MFDMEAKSVTMCQVVVCFTLSLLTSSVSSSMRMCSVKTPTEEIQKASIYTVLHGRTQDVDTICLSVCLSNKTLSILSSTK